MGAIKGERTIEIAAPIERCYQVASDVDHAADWQTALVSVKVLERDAEQRAALAETMVSTPVKTVRCVLRYSYEEPKVVRWEQVEGDARSMHGSWSFEDLGDGRTRGTYVFESDPGRMLSMLLVGPAEARVRERLLGGATEDFKKRMEG